MTDKNVLTDIRVWILTKSDITNLTTTGRIWKYHIRTVNDVLFGVTGLIAIVIDLLPGANLNKFSSQKTHLLNIKGYCSDTVNANGEKTAEDGEDKCWNFYHIFDEIFNIKSRETLDLTNFLILGMSRADEGLIQFDIEQECPFIVVNYDFNYLLK